MREIKFRAWDHDDKKMWKVVAISESIWCDCEEKHIKICDFDKSPSVKETDVRLSVNYELMQYTGLKDKNGREIYEGDIIKCFVKGDSKVVFKHGCFCLESLNYGNVTAFCDVFGAIEIIGNIYEKPELLEDK